MRSYDIALGFAPDGDKQEQEDGRTPEGKYIIEGRNPSIAHHRSLKIRRDSGRDQTVIIIPLRISAGDA